MAWVAKTERRDCPHGTLRFPSVLAVAAIELVTGLIAAEFGASRRAQFLAALSMAVAPVVIISGHLLSTTVFDISRLDAAGLAAGALVARR